MSNDEIVQSLLGSSSLEEAQKAWNDADAEGSVQIYTELCEKADAMEDKSRSKWLPTEEVEGDQDSLLEQACAEGNQEMVSFFMEIGTTQVLLV